MVTNNLNKTRYSDRKFKQSIKRFLFKKSFVALLTLVLFACVVIWYQKSTADAGLVYTDDLLNGDGSFDSVTAYNNWTFVNTANSTPSRDTTVFRTGTASAKQTAPPGIAKGYYKHQFTTPDTPMMNSALLDLYFKKNSYLFGISKFVLSWAIYDASDTVAIMDNPTTGNGLINSFAGNVDTFTQYTKSNIPTTSLARNTTYTLRLYLDASSASTTTNAYWDDVTFKIAYTVDTDAPVTNMSSPANSSVFNTSQTLQAASTDAFGTNRVDFEYASNPDFTGATTLTGAVLSSGTAQNGTWSVNWDTSALSSGTYYVRAMGFDDAGFSAYSASYYTYTIDKTGPSFGLTYYSDVFSPTSYLPTYNGKTYVKAGTVYIGLTNMPTDMRTLDGDTTVTINAPGTANDVSNKNLSYSVYSPCSWTITASPAGTTQNEGEVTGVSVKGTDNLGNIAVGPPTSGGSLIIDTIPPTFNLKYYYDAELTNLIPSVNGKPKIKTGTIYVKLEGNEMLATAAGSHTLTVDAQGTTSDITNKPFVWDAGKSAWKCDWTVNSSSDGDTVSIKVTGKDFAGNPSTNVVPTEGAVVTVDSTPPALNLRYFRDADLQYEVSSINGKPLIGAGTIYVKLETEALSNNIGDNQITIDAPGSVNDRVDQEFVWDAVNNTMKYVWNVQPGELNNGDTTSIIVKATDAAGNVSTGAPTVGGTVTLETSAPVLSLFYYADPGLTNEIPVINGKPAAKAQTVYVKLVSDKTLASTVGANQLTINAPGTANDLTNQNFSWDAVKSAWVCSWTITGGNDGDTEAITVKGTDLAGNVTSGTPMAGGTVTIDTTSPNLSLQYYSDAALTNLWPVVGGKPIIRSGITYVKLVTNENLRNNAGDQQITIDARGIDNDVNQQNFSYDAGLGCWKYAWNIKKGTDGDTLGITVKGTDLLGNTVTGAPASGGTVKIDNIGPGLSLEYYTDAGMTTPLPIAEGKPVTKAGTVFIKLVPKDNETLRNQPGDNQITIDAHGTSSDVQNGDFISTGNGWCYEWTVGEGSDGDTFAINVKGTDIVGNVTNCTPTSGQVVTIDNSSPVLSLAYYTDTGLTTPVRTVGGKPVLAIGTYYIKLVSNEALLGTPVPKITLDAPGENNDRTNANFVWDSDKKAWKYAWNIIGSNDGDTSSITVIAQNVVGLETSGAPSAGGIATIKTIPGPTFLDLTTSDKYVANDNTASATITAHLTDQYGNAVTDHRQINFSTNIGKLGATYAVTDDSGNAVVAIKSGDGALPPIPLTGKAVIKGTLNGVRSVTGTTELCFGPADDTPPTLEKAEATSKQIVYLTFNEPIEDPTVPATLGSITINGGMTIVQTELTNDTRIVRLTLGTNQGTGNKPEPDTNKYTVTVANITDLAGNILLDTVAKDFEAYTPHGKYSSGELVTASNSTRMCGQCHVGHNSVGEKLVNEVTITKVCFVCHGVTGISDYKVEGEFTTRINNETNVSFSLHKTLDYEHPGNDVFYCTDCHNPHGNKIPGEGNAVYPKLLRSRINNTEYHSGNDYCFGCHGTADSNKAFAGDADYYNNTGGDHHKTNAVHYNLEVQNSAMAPSSGTEVTCVLCHEKHGSRYDSLLVDSVFNAELDKNNINQVCLKCHGNDFNYSMNNLDTNYNVYERIRLDSPTYVSRHNIFDPQYGLSCTSCHGPHAVGNNSYSNATESALSDITEPFNTKIPFAPTTGRFSEYCLKCHQSGDKPVAVTNSSTIVPGTIKLPDTDFTNAQSGMDKTAFTSAGHYNPGGYECNKCHEVHGSRYQWLVLANVDDTFNNTFDTGASPQNSCFIPCHNQDISASINTDLKTVYEYPYTHPTFTTNGVHSNTENWAGKEVARHAECTDCHDVHTAKGTTRNGSDETNLLGGVTGLKISSWGSTNWSNWGSETPEWELTGLTSSSKQAELCLKCHSKFAYNLVSANGDVRAPHTNLTATNYKQTDIAREFNPNNPAYHAVLGASKMPSGYGKFVNGWSYNSKMKCTDCHMPSSGAKGPHGSPYRYILKAPWNPTSATGTITGRRSDGDTSSHLCFLCHDYSYYTGGTGYDTELPSQFSGDIDPVNGHGHAVGCAKCHGGLPHGWKYTDSNGDGISLAKRTDPMPYSEGTGYSAGFEGSGTGLPGSWGCWECH